MNPAPKPATYHDEDYLAFIRSQPCVVTGEKAEPHHLEGKKNDYATVPLSRKMHTELHAGGLKDFEAFYRVNLWKDAHRHFLTYVMGKLIAEVTP